MMGSETDNINQDLRESLLQRYQNELEEKIKGSEFVFDIVFIYCIIIFIKQAREEANHT